MATLTNPTLKIQKGLPNKMVKADVTCKVNFSAAELDAMKHGTKYVAACRLMGDDPEFLSGLPIPHSLPIPTPIGSIDIDLPFTSDPVEFTYPQTLIFPDRTPAATEDVAFSAVMPSNKLNEDDLPWLSLEDEIYAVVTLKNTKTGAAVHRNSNIVKGYF